ncbi:apolipoprotein N-acyltransferase [Fictibacillus barbaricus]|uniref:Apolipoprotein N-acyltransferase n=1 Tax=Fictibacillus barbaricus TaxID=182136 RepID=A0ABU1U1C1_9BACL|nr:apolipoprotein N-acyltransferase [Fictibacillus barbaricus]
MRLKLKHLLLVAVVLCLITFPLFPLTEWLLFSLLFITFFLIVSLIKTKVKLFWITFPISFLSVLLLTYLINTYTSAKISYPFMIGMGCFQFVYGLILKGKRDKEY